MHITIPGLIITVLILFGVVVNTNTVRNIYGDLINISNDELITDLVAKIIHPTQNKNTLKFNETLQFILSVRKEYRNNDPISNDGDNNQSMIYNE